MPLVNWGWFHAHRRAVRSFWLSAVVHALLVLLLAFWYTRPPGHPGVRLLGEADQGWELVQLPPSRIVSTEPLEVPEDPEEEASGLMDDPVVVEADQVEAPRDLPQLEAPRPRLEVPGPRADALASRAEAPPRQQENRKDALGEHAARPPAGPERAMAEAGPADAGAEFFGIGMTGKRVVFLVDCSRSMRGLAWERATHELLECLRRLKADQSFYVVFFDIEARSMFDPNRPEPEPIPPTRESIRRLAEWVSTLELGFQTEPLEAVKRAVQLQPDVVCLLSDGEFGGSTRAYLQEVNSLGVDDEPGRHKFIVHTIALYSRQGESMLRQIARENGGTYRFVADPTPDWEVFVQERSDGSDVGAIYALLAQGAELESDPAERIVKVAYSGDDEGLELLRGLADLQEVSLEGSNVSDAGLARVARLTGLRILDLSSCAISDAGLRHVRPMSRLRGLLLDGTQVTDRGMRIVAELSYLRLLSTPGNLTDAGVEPLKALQNLETLFLVESRLSDSGLAPIGDLGRLRHLVLDSTRITDAGLKHVQGLADLESLHLKDTNVQGGELNRLSRLGRLRELSLSGTGISDDDLVQLEPLENLQTLRIERTAIGDGAIPHLARLPNLQYVAASETRFSREGRRRLKEMFPGRDVLAAPRR